MCSNLQENRDVNRFDLQLPPDFRGLRKKELKTGD
jgi:hypothetical protein